MVKPILAPVRERRNQLAVAAREWEGFTSIHFCPGTQQCPAASIAQVSIFHICQYCTGAQCCPGISITQRLVLHSCQYGTGDGYLQNMCNLPPLESPRPHFSSLREIRRLDKSTQIGFCGLVWHMSSYFTGLQAQPLFCIIVLCGPGRGSELRRTSELSLCQVMKSEMSSFSALLSLSHLAPHKHALEAHSALPHPGSHALYLWSETGCAEVYDSHCLSQAWKDVCGRGLCNVSS